MKHKYIIIIGHTDAYTDPEDASYEDMTVNEAIARFDADIRVEQDICERYMVYHDAIITSKTPMTLHGGL